MTKNTVKRLAAVSTGVVFGLVGIETIFIKTSLASSFNITQSFFPSNLNMNGGEGFGVSVGISGDKVIVGAFGDDTGARDSGTAYLFDTSTGNLLQHFLNPTPATNDLFGNAVAISEDRVLIGARNDRSGMPNDGTGSPVNHGAAYLFDASTGNLLQTFLKQTSPALDNFGASVAIEKDMVLIGAPRENSTGASYLYDGFTGNLLQTFANPNPIQFSFDTFGHSVAISGNNILIGAPGNDTGERDSGAAYLFDATTGNLLQSFLNPIAGVGDSFGSSVAIYEDKVLIGAPQDDALFDGKVGFNSGAAYLFDASTGNLLQTVLSPTPTNSQRFGSSVALDGDNLLIGAWAVFKGSGAYLFDAATGNLVQTFLPPLPTNESFGNSVDIAGDKVLIGDVNDDTVGLSSGAAYLFQKPSSTVNIPEPSFALGLFALSTLGVGAELKRRQKQQKL